MGVGAGWRQYADGVDPEALRALVRDVPDFPRPGVVFKDLTPMFADAVAFRAAVDLLADRFADRGVDAVLGIEARGFILAAPVAYRLGAGLVPVRKPGKLPWHTEAQTYELEYGTDLLEIHRDALRPGQQVLVVDDLVATGGTAAAAANLVEHLGATVVGFAFVVELESLGARAKLEGYEVTSIVRYAT